jgi:hypothetical protein
METVKRGTLILAIAAAHAAAQSSAPTEGACDGKVVTSIAITPRDPSFLAFRGNCADGRAGWDCSQRHRDRKPSAASCSLPAPYPPPPGVLSL